MSLRYLWFTFLKIGCVSFGGNMALLAVCQRIMVERDKTLSRPAFFDAVGIASVLPGPMAVNAVTFIGYQHKKVPGALVSLVAVLLPASVLMLVLSWIYFTYAAAYVHSEVIHYVAGAVCAIILTTAYGMHQKEIGKDWFRSVVCLSAFGLTLWVSGFWVTLLVIIAGACLGIWYKLGTDAGEATASPQSRPLLSRKVLWYGGALLLCIAAIECLFFFNVQAQCHLVYLKLALVFSGLGPVMFGGGLVAIPMMQSLFVHDLAWISSAEFVDAIAFSQMTPGPILVSATFIGYKLGGLPGGILATVGMFLPTALLTMVMAEGHALLKHNPIVRRGLNGVKVVIIGLTAAAACKMMMYAGYNLKMMALCVIAFVVMQAFKVSPVVTVLVAGLLGFLVEKVI